MTRALVLLVPIFLSGCIDCVPLFPHDCDKSTDVFMDEPWNGDFYAPRDLKDNQNG